MAKFHLFDELRQHCPHLAQDPAFYERRLELRELFPDAAPIEIEPAPWSRTEIIGAQANGISVLTPV